MGKTIEEMRRQFLPKTEEEIAAEKVAEEAARKVREEQGRKLREERAKARELRSARAEERKRQKLEERVRQAAQLAAQSGATVQQAAEAIKAVASAAGQIGTSVEGMFPKTRNQWDGGPGHAMNMTVQVERIPMEDCYSFRFGLSGRGKPDLAGFIKIDESSLVGAAAGTLEGLFEYLIGVASAMLAEKAIEDRWVAQGEKDSFEKHLRGKAARALQGALHAGAFNNLPPLKVDAAKIKGLPSEAPPPASELDVATVKQWKWLAGVGKAIRRAW